MSDKRRNGSVGRRKGYRSDFAPARETAETLDLTAFRLGQRNPDHYPQHCPPAEVPEFPLGSPLAIEDVAAIFGCSPWTVRQKYLPLGLPHLRTSGAGKLVFFQDQIVRWILERQEKQTKGGTE